ncbi:MAG TPA: cytochrome C, partial [Burkholderiales bacterium]|nr:cytochrome C [Burkholderiales bacterium]
MFTSERAVVIAIGAAALAACASLQPAPGKPPAFGAAVSAEEVARWDISVPPSGAGLPKGGGSARQGLKVYEEKCQSCHG